MPISNNLFSRSLGLAPGNSRRRVRWIIVSITTLLLLGIASQLGTFDPSFQDFFVPDDRVVVFSPRGTEYLTLNSGALAEFSLSGETLWSYPSSSVHDACYLPDGGQVAIELESVLVLWDCETRTPTARIELPTRDRRSGVRSQMRASPDGRWLAIWQGRGGDTMVVDLKANRTVGTLPADITEVAFTNSPNQLIRVLNSRFEIWDLDPLHRRSTTEFPSHRTSPGLWSQVISERGGYIATIVSFGSMQLWDLGMNREIGVREIDSIDRFAMYFISEQPSRTCCFGAGDSVLVTNGLWIRRKTRLKSSFPFYEMGSEWGRVITAWDVKSLQPIRTWHFDFCGSDDLHPIASTSDFIARTAYDKCRRFRIR